LLNSDKNC